MLFLLQKAHQRPLSCTVILRIGRHNSQRNYLTCAKLECSNLEAYRSYEKLQFQFEPVSYSLRFKWLAHPDDNKNAAVAAFKTAEQLDPETSGRPGATFQWRHGSLSSLYPSEIA